MLKPLPFANAASAVGVVLFIVCSVVVYFFPDIYSAIAASWYHGIAPVTPQAFSVNNLLTGIVSFGVAVWVVAFVFAWVYDNMAK